MTTAKAKKPTLKKSADLAAALEVEASFAFIPTDRIQLNDYNARRFVEGMTPQRQARFDELVESVRSKGIIEPIVVRPLGREKYEVIAGERRYRAAVATATTEIPCMIRDVDADEAFDLMVIENLQREDLTPFETAQAFRTFLDRHGNAADAVSSLSLRTGIPTHAIRRQVRLLTLPAPVLSAWKDGGITQSHAEMFTRVGDASQIPDLLAICLRSRLSVKELAERIATAAPELARGFFDKTDCATCQYNSSVQSGLFADHVPGGKCCNAACFEERQGAFLLANWAESKPAKLYGTTGFRFGHRLGEAHREMCHAATAERCLSCDAFVTVMRLTGAVIGQYERTCVGPVVCFDELYRPPAPESSSTLESDPPESPESQQTATPAATKQPATPATKQPATPPPDETGPVCNAERGKKAREQFIKANLPALVAAAPADHPSSLRLTLTALAMASTAVKTSLTASFKWNNNLRPDQMAAKIYELPAAELPGLIIAASLYHVLHDFTLMPEVRRLVAERFGIDFARDWRITRDYLQSLTKSEIVRVGEEVGIWKEEKVEAWLMCHHKGKALLALTKEDLVDCFILSEVDLAGKVPAEILGTARK